METEPFSVLPDGTLGGSTARGDIRDRMKGCMLCSASFDAMGLWASSRGRPADMKAFKRDKSDGALLSPRNEQVGYRNDGLCNKYITGDWSQHTEQAIMIMLGCMEDKEAYSHREFGERVVIWSKQGIPLLESPRRHLDPDFESMIGLLSHRRNPRAVSQGVAQAIRNFRSPHNTPLARTHALGVICATKTIYQTFETAAEFCMTTHPDARCIVCCAIGTALVRGLILGQIRHTQAIHQTMVQAMKWFNRWRVSGGRRLPPVDQHEF